jgi:hypothetical protein
MSEGIYCNWNTKDKRIVNITFFEKTFKIKLLVFEIRMKRELGWLASCCNFGIYVD